MKITPKENCPKVVEDFLNWRLEKLSIEQSVTNLLIYGVDMIYDDGGQLRHLAPEEMFKVETDD